MNENKKQEKFSDLQIIIDALQKDNPDNPDLLKRVEDWKEIERKREEFLNRFPSPKGCWTEEQIEEVDSKVYSADHLIFSDAMMELTFNALFRKEIHQLIAKHTKPIDGDFLLLLTAELLPFLSSLKHLNNTLSKKVTWRNEGEKEEAIQQALTELWERWADKKPYIELIEKVVEGEYTKILPRAVRNRLIDEYRKKEGLISLDKVVETANGSKTTILDILTPEYDFLQTQPQEMEEYFTQEQRQQLEQLLGKTGLKILEYRLKNTEIIGLEGEKKGIAQALRIAESTVGLYVGTKNRIGIFAEKAGQICKILS